MKMLLLLAGICTGTVLHAQKEKTVEVGGAAMYPSKDIVTNAANSKDHTTLVAAVQAAGLAATLKTPGPFTVFAPTNAAFDLLPSGTVGYLLKPENKPLLTEILTYHVVAGKYSVSDIESLIKKGKGKAMLKTVSGHTLWFFYEGKHIVVKDEKSSVAHITISNVYQSNGVIHVIDHVLQPE
jgi:uncharacterized surface protein with fasciclin (FAS1) repeats